MGLTMPVSLRYILMLVAIKKLKLTTAIAKHIKIKFILLKSHKQYNKLQHYYFQFSI